MPVPEPVMTATRSAMVFLLEVPRMSALWTLVANGKMVRACAREGFMARFAAIGLDHRHVYDLTKDLLDAGAECVGYNPDTTDPRVLAGSASGSRRCRGIDGNDCSTIRRSISWCFPARPVRPRRHWRSRAMRRGKDVMVGQAGRHDVRATRGGGARAAGDRPAVVGLRRARRRRRRSGSIARRAFGGTGRVVPGHVAWRHTGLIAHCARRGSSTGPPMAELSTISACTRSISSWRWRMSERRRSNPPRSARLAPSPRGSRISPRSRCERRRCAGYCRVNGSRRMGLPDWGDGRFFVVGTQGTLELRKNMDIEGREGTDHLFVANRSATRYVDCSALPVLYYRDFLLGIVERTETAMPQRLTFSVCRLALQAQAQAVRYTARR